MEIERKKDNVPVRVTTSMYDLVKRASTQNFVPVVDDKDAFIGIITAFVATSINGKSSDGKTDGGFLSIAVLIVAVVLYLILEKIATKFNLKKFEPFVMPLAMFGAMGAAVLLTTVLPAELVTHSWFN